VARGEAAASRSPLTPTAFRRSTNSMGGRKASGEGPTLSSSLYREGERERGCRTEVDLPSGRSAEALRWRSASDRGEQRIHRVQLRQPARSLYTSPPP